MKRKSTVDQTKVWIFTICVTALVFFHYWGTIIGSESIIGTIVERDTKLCGIMLKRSRIMVLRIEKYIFLGIKHIEHFKMVCSVHVYVCMYVILFTVRVFIECEWLPVFYVGVRVLKDGWWYSVHVLRRKQLLPLVQTVVVIQCTQRPAGMRCRPSHYVIGCPCYRRSCQHSVEQTYWWDHKGRMPTLSLWNL